MVTVIIIVCIVIALGEVLLAASPAVPKGWDCIEADPKPSIGESTMDCVAIAVEIVRWQEYDGIWLEGIVIGRADGILTVRASDGMLYFLTEDD